MSLELSTPYPSIWSESSSSKSKSTSPIDTIIKKVQLWHYQYEVTFSLYILTPTEKIIMNTIVLSSLSLLIYGIVALTPLFVTQFLSRAISSLFWVYVNDSGNHLVVQQTSSSWVNVTKIGWEELGPHSI
ncbi:hypothetical protein VTL71DRAFT_44 [Oculimacula yallundae]|uniref:Uncharacterized protein n=1 Tax=Oculimacula yallundae TaxID=86028 RepID=A0ABR4CYX5_9HELO